MNNVVIDSSVFVAAFLGNERHSTRAKELLERVDRGAIRAYVPLTVLVEVVAAVYRRTGDRSDATMVSERILTTTGFDIIDIGAAHTETLLMLAAHSGCKGMDVMVLAASVVTDAALVTLDIELAARAAGFVSVLPLEELSLDGF